MLACGWVGGRFGERVCSLQPPQADPLCCAASVFHSLFLCCIAASSPASRRGGPQDAELASWKAVVGERGVDAGARGPPAYWRLASDEEVAALVRQAEELLRPKQPKDAGGAASACLTGWRLSSSFSVVNTSLLGAAIQKNPCA